MFYHGVTAGSVITWILPSPLVIGFSLSQVTFTMLIICCHIFFLGMSAVRVTLSAKLS